MDGEKASQKMHGGIAMELSFAWMNFSKYLFSARALEFEFGPVNLVLQSRRISMLSRLNKLASLSAVLCDKYP